MKRFVVGHERVLWLLPMALLAAWTLPSQAVATTVAQVCAFGANSCAGGVANINSRTLITDGSVLDFRAAGFPRVNVNGTGALKLEVIENQGGDCPLKPTTTMTILAGDLTIRTPTVPGGGEVTGDNTDLAGTISDSGRFNGGSIWIDLQVGANSLGNLLIEPGGRLTSDRLGRKGKGRGGSITVTAEGQIWEQVGAGGGLRGIISANSQSSSRAMFFDNCGRTEITLLATGEGIVGPPTETIIIEGDVLIVSPPPSNEGFIGGVITIMAGSESNKLTLPPFPSANPPKVPANPPQNPPLNNGTFFETSTGQIIVQAKDSGGAEVHIYDCVAIVNGLIQVGGPGDNAALIEGREQDLPNLLSITSNDTTTIDLGGKLLATLKEGWKQHLGQGPLCAFTPINPPKNNGPIPGSLRGGSDVCLITRGDLLIDGTTNVHGPSLFAVENDILGGSQTAGVTQLLTTQDGNIDLLGQASSTNGIGNGSKGGMTQIQSDVDTNLGDAATPGVVEAKGLNGGVGGMIQVEAVNGALKGGVAGSKLDAGSGSVTVRSCQAVTGFPPAVSIPPFIPLAPSCGVAVLITPVPALTPCGFDCFCLRSFRLQGGVLTVNGQGLTGVTVLEVNATSCDPGSGTALVINLPKDDSKITANFAGALIPGRHIILSNPAGPSSSCSLPFP